MTLYKIINNFSKKCTIVEESQVAEFTIFNSLTEKPIVRVEEIKN